MIERQIFIKQFKPEISGLKTNVVWNADLPDVNQNYRIRLNRGVYSVFAVVPLGNGTTMEYYAGKRYKLTDAKHTAYDHYEKNYDKYKRG